MSAAVRLVSERGTTAIAVTEITRVADVSRKLLYLHFGDRDALLVAAAVHLVGQELIPRTVDVAEDLPAQLLAVAEHFADHSEFYRAMLSGSCAFAMTRTLNHVFGSYNKEVVRELFGVLDSATGNDLAVFFASGASGIVNDWLIDGAHPPDPRQLAERLTRLASVFGFTHHEGHAK